MGKHKNTTQDAIMLGAMQKNEELAKGYTKGNRLKSEELWKDLTIELNNNGPPIKDTSGWKKVWMDWKAAVRRKIANNNIEAKAAGLGPFNKSLLTGMDEAVAQVCGMFSAIEDVENSMDFGDTYVVEEIADCEDMSHDNVASTSSAYPTEKAPKGESWNHCMKHFMRTQTEAMVSIAQQLKEMNEYKDSLQCAEDLKRELRDTNRELKQIKNILHNKHIEEKRHNVRMEHLREEEIQIKKRKLEQYELKTNY